MVSTQETLQEDRGNMAQLDPETLVQDMSWRPQVSEECSEAGTSPMELAVEEEDNDGVHAILLHAFGQAIMHT